VFIGVERVVDGSEEKRMNKAEQSDPEEAV
jgi:hypothetical protein